jgi:hypothetical protein
MAKVPSTLLAVTVSIALLVGMTIDTPSLAQNQPSQTADALPSDAQLDALLAAHDWNALGAAIASFKQGPPVMRMMDWLHTRIDAGGGSLLGFLYAPRLWGAGSFLKNDDPSKDMRVNAGMIVLYTYELIQIDGVKCDDQTAPAHRVEQLFARNRPVLAYLKAEPTSVKANVVAGAIALEKHTAPLRKDDDLLCRDGEAQMRAGIEDGTRKAVQDPTGNHYGQTVEVVPPPGWKPAFVAPDKYEPLQEQARSNMESKLLALLQ